MYSLFRIFDEGTAVLRREIARPENLKKIGFVVFTIVENFANLVSFSSL